jgi:thiamine-phosphate diphosphorylase
VTRDARVLLSEGRGLYLVLTAPVIPHLELARAACERGVPALQLREKDMPDDELLLLATELASLARGYPTLFVLNDRPDLAAACGADGVHVGQGDEDVAAARATLGPEAIVGLSTRTPGESTDALAAGADYVGVGPVFPTDTKPDALAPIWLPGLREVSAAVPDLPKVAIGGITVDTAAEVMDAGADYVAVISAICHAPDPIAAIDEFVEATLDH